MESGSTRVIGDRHEELIPATHECTWTLEAVEMIFLSYCILMRRPFNTFYAWSQDAVGNGLRIRVGGFGTDGLCIRAYHPSDSWGFGLLVSRKVSQL